MPSEIFNPNLERSPIVERPQALQQIVDNIDPKAALMQDRASCLDEQLFLRSVLRTPQRPMTEVLEILVRKLESPRISEARRREIAEHIAQLRLFVRPRLVAPVLPGETLTGLDSSLVPPALPLESVDALLVPPAHRTPPMPKMVLISPSSLPESPSVDPQAFVEDENSPTKPIRSKPSVGALRDASSPTITLPVMPKIEVAEPEVIPPTDLVAVDDEGALMGPATITPVFGHAGDSQAMPELPVLSAEQMVERSALESSERGSSRDREIVTLNRGFVFARQVAERWVKDEKRRPALEEALSSTLEGVLESHAELETQYGFSVELIRGRVTDELTVAYFEALERAGDHSLGFRESFRAYVNLRARLGALLREEQRLRSVEEKKAAVRTAEQPMTLLEARNVLGVFDNAGRDDVEKAYVIRLQALDLQEAVDEPVIADLMRARETLLEFIEQQETEQERARDAADVASVPEVDVLHVPPKHRADRWYIEALRKPGRILRGLFFGGVVATGAGATGVALHEFADATKDPMHDVGHDYSLGVIPGPFDGVNFRDLFPEAKATAPKPVETPAEQIRSVPHGSSIWAQTQGMLRERGLKPTNALTSYFVHLVEALNKTSIEAAGGVKHLPDNFPLIVTPIVEEMNAMAGITPAASEPSVASTKSSSEKTSVVSGGSSVEKVSVAHQDRVVPTVDSPMRVMAKGEYLGKVTHSMLRAGGLNWTTARINQLNAMVWEQNLPLFERLVKEGKMRKLKPEYIPIGVELDFSTAAQEVQRLVKAKKPAKKGG